MKKAPGWDLIAARLIKDLPQKCIRLLTILFSRIIALERFPAISKIARIIKI